MMKLPFGYGLMNGLRPKKREEEGCKQEQNSRAMPEKRPLTVFFFLRLPIMHRDASCVSL